MNTNFINIYPNPAKNILYIENTTRITMLILNQRGELVKEQAFEPGTNTLDISVYEDGVYILRAIGNSGTLVRRLVKMKEN